MVESAHETRDRLLEEIADWNDRVALADHRVDELIVEAIAAGCTQDQIAVSLGVSRQGACKRINRRKLKERAHDGSR